MYRVAQACKTRSFMLVCLFQLPLALAAILLAQQPAPPRAASALDLAADEPLRANLHVHDQPAFYWDWKGFVDHTNAGWTPKMCLNARNIGLTGLVINPHGLTTVNGGTTIQKAGRYSDYPDPDWRSGTGPRHWDNQRKWTQQASTGGFVALRAFEWTGRHHIDVIGSDRWCDSIVAMEAEDRPKIKGQFDREHVDWIDEIEDVGPWVAKNPQSIYGGTTVCQFNHADVKAEDVGWRSLSSDDYKALHKSWDTAAQYFTLFQLGNVSPAWPHTHADWKYAETLFYRCLQGGFRVGPTLGSDNLGYLSSQDRNSHTGVWADSTDQRDFLKALRERRVFASTDRETKVDMLAESNGSSAPMGSSLAYRQGETLKLTIGTSTNHKVGRVSVIGLADRWSEPHTVHWYDVTASSETRELELNPEDGTKAYYVRVEGPAKNPSFTLSAPIWLDPEPVQSAPASAGPTTTVFTIDCSGSMSETTPDGEVKLDAAKSCVRNVLDVIRFDKEQGRKHEIGLVAFSSSLVDSLSPTEDVAEFESHLAALAPNSQTDFGVALWSSVELFAGRQGNNYLVFLSDGMTNSGHISRAEFLNDDPGTMDLYGEIRRLNIKPFTIGFGDPSHQANDQGLDEEVLIQIAEAPKTGGHYCAAGNVAELRAAYLASFHASTGSIVYQKSGLIAQGETRRVGPFDLTSSPGTSRTAKWSPFRFCVPPAYAADGDSGQLLVTLAWAAGRLGFELRDPAGRVVDASYPGVRIKADSNPICIAINSPRSGNWSGTVTGEDVPGSATDFNVVASGRASGSGGGGGGGGSLTWQDVAAIVAAACAFMLLIATVAVVSQRRQRRSPSGRSRARSRHAVGVLIVQPDGQPAFRVPLAGYITVGRDGSCDIRSPSPNCSRQQAAIVRRGDGWIVRDLSNRGTTLVNGRAVTFHDVSGGETIEVPGLRVTISLSA